VIEQGRQHGPVPRSLQRIGGWSLPQRAVVMVAKGRRHPFAVHRARALHPQHRVIPDRVTLTAIGAKRGRRREVAPHDMVGERLRDDRLAPGDDVGLSDGTGVFETVRAGEGLKVADILLGGAVGVGVGKVGAPYVST
jgi:hypothetical protein